MSDELEDAVQKHLEEDKAKDAAEEAEDVADAAKDAAREAQLMSALHALQAARVEAANDDLAIADRDNRIKLLEKQLIELSSEAWIACHLVPWDRYDTSVPGMGSDKIIADCKRAGINMLTIDLPTPRIVGNTNTANAKELITALIKDGTIRFAPSPDGSANTGFQTQTVQQTGDALLNLYETSAPGAAVKTYVDEPWLSSFKADGVAVSKWEELIEYLELKMKRRVRFHCVFLSGGTNNVNFKNYAPLADRMTMWGSVKPANVAGHKVRADLVHTLKNRHNEFVLYDQFVRVQDVRQRTDQAHTFAETGNLDLFLACVEESFKYGDGWHIVTMNDRKETSEVWTDKRHRTVFLDLLHFFGVRFRTGSWPPVAEPWMVLTHRTHFVADAPTYKPTLDHNPANPVPPTSDNTQVVAFCPPGSGYTVSVNDGPAVPVSAPYTKVSVKLRVGQQKAVMMLNGKVVDEVVSPDLVSHTPTAPIMAYHAVSSK